MNPLARRLGAKEVTTGTFVTYLIVFAGRKLVKYVKKVETRSEVATLILLFLVYVCFVVLHLFSIYFEICLVY